MNRPADEWSDRSERLAATLSRVALGDRAAFATLYRDTRSHLYAVILRINPDRAQAEDVLQEVFVNVWRAAQSFDADCSQPLTWLTSVARHRAIDSLRRRKTEVPTVSTHVENDDGDDEDRLASMASDRPGPLQLLESVGEALAIRHCLGELSAEQQQCLALTYYQGLSHAEAAAQLAQPLGTVKSWVRRALMSLKDCLGRGPRAGETEMDYSRPELADRLAAEYVLGTLRGPARRRFEALLPAHPALRQAVSAWRQRIEPLSASVAEVAPPDAVWGRIETRLFADVAAAAPRPQTIGSLPWLQRLSFWRGLTGLATAAVLALVVVGSQTPPPQAPIIVVLAANPESAQAMNASFVASLSADGRALVLRPLNDLSLTPGRALELWAVPAAGAPRSLGLVNASGATTLLRDTAAFAVSIEPAGGSTTGAPTGPIVSVGKPQS